MTRPVLGLDIDDTAVVFMDRFLPYLRQRGVVAPASALDITGYHTSEWLGVTAVQAQHLIDDFQRDEGVHLHPVDGATPALAYLAQRWDIVAVTARPMYTAPITIALIQKHFGGSINQVIHAGLGPTHTMVKWQLVYALGVRVMIEDSLHHAQEAAAHGMRVVLMDRGYGWNRREHLPAGVQRVTSWGQTVRLLRRWERTSWPTNRLTTPAVDLWV